VCFSEPRQTKLRQNFPIEQMRLNRIKPDEMAAASYSSDVLQASYEPKLCVTKFIESLRAATRKRIFQISEAIKNLPLEIREKIDKEFVTIKLRERKEMGCNEVRNDMEEAPFCEKRLQRSCFAVIVPHVA